MASGPKRQRVESESSEGSTVSLQSDTSRDSIKTLEGSPQSKDVVITESDTGSATSGTSPSVKFFTE